MSRHSNPAHPPLDAIPLSRCSARTRRTGVPRPPGRRVCRWPAFSDPLLSPRLLSNEPIPAAILLGTFGLLMLMSALVSRASGRIGVPVALLFLGVGMAAGSEGIGGIAFEDYRLTFRLGTAALVLILFDGGINTPVSHLKQSIRPAAVLAT